MAKTEEKTVADGTKKHPEDGPKKHTLKLTRGAVELAKGLTRRGEWYEKDPDNFDVACALLEHPIFSSQKAPRCPYKLSEHLESEEDKAIYMERREEWEQDVLEPWQDEVVEHQLDEDERQALKDCVAYFKKKAALGATLHVLCLLRELGLTKR